MPVRDEQGLVILIIMGGLLDGSAMSWLLDLAAPPMTPRKSEWNMDRSSIQPKRKESQTTSDGLFGMAYRTIG